MILLLAAAQAVMSVPATPGPKLPPVTAGYAMVVARAVRQSDPIPIDCGGTNCTSWFLGEFDRTQQVAGQPLPSKFQARLEMGSPFLTQYELAMVIETLADGTRRVRAAQGFHYRTKLACFDVADTEKLTPPPSGQRLVRQGRQLCVK